METKTFQQNETNFLNDYGQYADSRMRAIGEYFSDLMGCGPEGWCAFRWYFKDQSRRKVMAHIFSCPTERQFARSNNHQRLFPNPAAFGNSRNQPIGSSRGMSRYPYVNRNPAIRTTTLPPTIKTCANACMPQCNNRCLQVCPYSLLSGNWLFPEIQSNCCFIHEFVNSNRCHGTACERGRKREGTNDNVLVRDHKIFQNIRFSPKKTVECRDECMPYCTPQCLDAYSMADMNSKPKVCKAGVQRTSVRFYSSVSVCMPDCTQECITAPPLMVPCVFDTVCHCPAG